MTVDARLLQQLAFCLEVDGAKTIVRHNLLADGSRRENDAEHMWHLALMAIVLAEHAAEAVDLARVLSMLVIHDLVEIDAGDTLVYEDAARADQAAREAGAAARIYGMLPAEQGEELRRLWEEFESADTPDARFARALDRLQPLMLNAAAGGGAWSEHGITADRVAQRNFEPIARGSPALSDAAREIVAGAIAAGILAPVASGAPAAGASPAGVSPAG